MTGKLVPWFLVTAFAAALGHLAWHALLGPTPAPEYLVGGDVLAMTGTDPGAKQLYLRRNLYLAHRPRHAWIQVLAKDRLNVYVNGKRVAGQNHSGFPVAVLIDLTPHLEVGHNAIAIVAHQAQLHEPPVVAVTGAYHLDDGDHPLAPDRLWRCASFFERRAHWWFATHFDDRHWPVAPTTRCFLRAKVDGPPRATTTTRFGRWVAPADAGQRRAAFAHAFAVAGRPRQAWLRVTATASYRVALNGLPFDQHEVTLGTPLPDAPLRRTYDVTALVRPGTNDLTFLVTSHAGPSHLLAEMEVIDGAGNLLRVASDGSWRARPGTPADWLRPSTDEALAWQRCVAHPGDLGVSPWQPARETLTVTLPLPATVGLLAGQLGLMAGVALLTLLACRWVGRRLNIRRGLPAGATTPGVVYLALVVPLAAIAAAALAVYDPRVTRQEVYRGGWVALAVAAVLVQWLLLWLWARGAVADRPAPATRPGRSPLWVTGLVALLVAAGFWLRVRDLNGEPMHSDEVTIHRASLGLLERAFPSLIIHPELPTYYISGCELECFGPALAALVFDTDTTVVRLPSAVWGTLTIGLIFVVGRRLFDVRVALIAAALYALSPTCIQRANFGRYPCLLQFLTLLLIYSFWRTVRGSGPIDRRWLALTGMTFVLMFLSWEGSALTAVGLVVAGLVQRRGRLATILGDPAVYAAMAAVLAVLLLQMAHNTIQASQFLLYGTGWSDITLRAMWRFPFFNLWRYVGESSFNLDALVPLIGLGAAGLVAVRHGCRRPLRALILIFLTTCFVMSALLSVFGGYYAFHLFPLFILMFAAALGAAARGLVRLGRAVGTPRGWARYAGAVAALTVALVVAFGSGQTVQLAELPALNFYGTRPGLLKNPDLTGAVRYLRRHFRAGDVVIAIYPETVNHAADPRRLGGFPPGWVTDYWLESTLQLPAVLDDRRPRPLHRWCATPMLPNRRSLEDVFARHNRVWYVTIPAFHGLYNDAEVSAFLRQHMDVVYEDFQTMVLLRDNNRRTAEQRLKDEGELHGAKAVYLP